MSDRMPLTDRLAAGPVICAEGFLFELERRGYLTAGEFVPEVALEYPDALRALHPADAPWTYWDYGPAFEANRGLRIDHALLSAELAERLTAASVEVETRAEEQPSDHAPVVFEIA